MYYATAIEGLGPTLAGPMLHVAFNLYFMFYFSKFYHHISIFRIKLIIFSFVILLLYSQFFELRDVWWASKWHVSCHNLTTNLQPTYVSTYPLNFLSQVHMSHVHKPMMRLIWGAILWFINLWCQECNITWLQSSEWWSHIWMKKRNLSKVLQLRPKTSDSSTFYEFAGLF